MLLAFGILTNFDWTEKWKALLIMGNTVSNVAFEICVEGTYICIRVDIKVFTF